MSDESPAQSSEQAAAQKAREREAMRRRLFAEAQEYFAAGDFAGARERLESLPLKLRTKDAQRLLQLVIDRLTEVAELRAGINAGLQREKWSQIRPQVERLIELQPGDRHALELMHKLEEREFGNARPVSVAPVILPTESVSGNGESPAQPQSRSANDKPLDVLDADDEDDMQEIWDVGERLAAKRPPPLPGETAADYEADEDILLEPTDASPAGVWIAAGVCAAVVFLAVISTIVVLIVKFN